MPQVNTFVNAFDKKDEVMVTLKPGDEFDPDRIVITNPDVIGPPPTEEAADPAVGAGQTESYDPGSADAVARATPQFTDDGLDRKSHAELDVVAEDEGVDFSALEVKPGQPGPTRQLKIDAIRAHRAEMPDE